MYIYMYGAVIYEASSNCSAYDSLQTFGSQFVTNKKITCYKFK